MLDHVYLSPHLDDAIYSCGGLIALQSAAGERVSVLTIFSGDPPTELQSGLIDELHARWQAGEAPVETRREEDRKACDLLGAQAQHLSYPDAVYRADDLGAARYATPSSIFGSLHPEEQNLVRELASDLQMAIDPGSAIIAPLGIGGHVDHRLVRLAAEHLESALIYYADFPYIHQFGLASAPDLPIPPVRTILEHQTWQVERWAAAIATYRSQLSTFWLDQSGIRADLDDYLSAWGGLPLWRKLQESAAS